MELCAACFGFCLKKPEKDILEEPTSASCPIHLTKVSGPNEKPVDLARLYNHGNVYIFTDNLLTQKTDAIVCLEDEDFLGNGPLVKAIKSKGGKKYKKERKTLHRQAGQVRTCSAGGQLLCKYVIHAVTPDDSVKNPDVELRRVYMNIFQEAHLKGVGSLAMPLLASGHGGFHPDECARVLVDVVIDLAENDDLIPAVHFVNNNSDTTRIILDAFQTAIRNRSDPQLRSQAAVVADEPAIFDPNAFYRHGAYRNQPRATSESLGSPALDGGNSNLDQMKASEQVQYGSTSSLKISDVEQDDSWFDERMRAKDSCVGYQEEQGYQTEVQSSNYSCPSSNTKQFGNVDISNSGMQKERVSSKYDSFETGGECSRCGKSANTLKSLPCNHRICETCANNGSTLACSVCDVTNVITGNQPIGKMDIQVRSDLSLPGFEGLGVVVIHYDFPHGVQKKGHPSPGSHYSGMSRVAYLPNSFEGQNVSSLLKIAFEMKLIFTIGRSPTTGQDNVIIWNGIEHKTAMTGGPQKNGYPDEDYLARVTRQLLERGVTG